MSQFIIKNWAGDDGRVEVFDLRRWDTRRELPGSIMYAVSDDEGRGIVPVEFAQALETDWSFIESQAADALEGDCSPLGADPERRQAVLDLMALHLLRSSEMLSGQLGLIAQGAAEALQEAQSDEEWNRRLEETGMSHEEALRMADAAIRNADGGLVSQQRQRIAETLPEYLDRYRALLRGCGLRLHRPKRSGGFLLGDGPAFLSPTGRLRKESTALFGRVRNTARGVHLDGNEWHCWMPLTPRVMAVAGPRVLSCSGVRPLASQVVRQFNAQQCWRAQFRVVLPQDDTAREREFVQQHARPTPPPVSKYPLIEVDPYEMWKR